MQIHIRQDIEKGYFITKELNNPSYRYFPVVLEKGNRWCDPIYGPINNSGENLEENSKENCFPINPIYFPTEQKAREYLNQYFEEHPEEFAKHIAYKILT